MAIVPGEDLDTALEPLPRGPVLDQGGQLSRAFFNWFQGGDRRLGKVISGINRNRQNIVQLQTDYTAADGTISSAYITADAVVASDAAGARATLSANLTATYQAADATLQTDINTRATSAALSTESTARASADNAAATRLDTLEATIDTPTTGLSARVTTAESAIVDLDTDKAEASTVTTLEAKVRQEIMPERVSVAADFTAQFTTFSATALSLGTVENVANYGDVRTFDNSALADVSNRAALPILAGRTYEIRCLSRVTVDGTSNAMRMSFSIFAADGSYLGARAFTNSDTSWTASKGWVEHSITVTTQFILDAFPTAAFVKGYAIGNGTTASALSGATWQVAYLRLSDETLSASVSTNASAIATLEDATAIYEIIAAASGGDPARIKLKAGVGGADVELDADRVWFGDETRFDTSSETFITEVGGVRSRYGTAFGASGNQVVMWHGPDSVAVGSEARNNGYLAIGTNGSIWHNTGQFDWGATASAAAAQTSIGTAAAIAGQGWGATAAEAAASNDVIDAKYRPVTMPERVSVAADFSAAFTTLNAAVLALGVVETVANYGSVRTFDNSALAHVSNRAALPILAGRTYEVRSLSRVTVDGTSNVMRLSFRIFAADGSYLGARAFTTVDTSWTVAKGWVEHSITATTQFILDAFPTAAFIKGYAIGNGTTATVLSGATWQVAYLRMRDATDPLKLATVEAGADVTSGKTAAAITGQGVFATGNYYEQAGDPGSVPNGSFWYKTTTDELFIRRSSAWGKVSDITPATIGTDRIAANAATAIQVTETAGTRSLTHDVWTTIATHSIAVGSGERVQFTGQLDIVTLTASGGTVNLPMLEARVQRAGSTIKERNLALGPAPRFSSPVFYTSDSPAAGTYSYTFQVRFKDYGDSSTRSCTIEDEFFESTLVKR